MKEYVSSITYLLRSPEKSSYWESHWMSLLPGDNHRQHMAEQTQVLLNNLGLMMLNKMCLVDILEQLIDAWFTRDHLKLQLTKIVHEVPLLFVLADA